MLDELSIFLRDHHSGETIDIDVGVLDFLAAVMDATSQTRATVLSAYRTAETNAMIAKTHFGVAENSQHIQGRALDVHFGNKLGDAMNAARAMKFGGVGWYPHSGFIHLDSGPVRNWDLDGRGLGDLLFNGQQVSFDASGRLVVNGPVRGGRAPLMVHGGRPITVRERLQRLRLVARAQFAARRR